MTTMTDFFSALVAAYPTESELRLEIRCLAPRWDAEREKPFPRRWYGLDACYLERAAADCEHWARDWDCYMGVLPRWEKSGSQDAVFFASCLFCDVDGGNEGADGAITLIKASDLPRPHIANVSGHGVHCYWFLDGLLPLPDRNARETFKKTLRRLCKAIGGESPYAHADTSACEVARVLRVPGTLNHKVKGAPVLVKNRRFCIPNNKESNSTVLGSSSNILNSYDWWRAHLPMEPAPKARKFTETYTPAGFVSDGLLRWASIGYPEGRRHQDFVGAAAWLVRDCKLAKPDAQALLLKKAAVSHGARAITEEEIESLIRWA